MLNNETANRSYMPALIGTALLILLGYFIMYFFYYSDTLSSITLPYLEDFSEVDRVEYRQIGGNWILEDGQLIQQDTDLVDIVAVIPSLTLESDQAYAFETNINILEGPKGGGLVFNMQDRDTIVSSHIVRLGNNEGTDYLIYGYFDGERKFNTQGAMNPENLADEFMLGIIVNDSSYIVLLNGEAVAVDVPLMHEGGSLALTTWNSKVAFDNVTVDQPAFPLPTLVESTDDNSAENVSDETVAGDVELAESDAEAGGDQVEGSEQIVGDVVPQIAIDTPYFQDFAAENEFTYEAFTGDWTIEDGAMVQNNPQLVDVVAAVPGVILPEQAQFEFNTEFRILEGAKGAGLVFNMQQPATVRGSHMLRLGNSGGNDYLIYGYFDDNRNFNPQGSKPVLGLTDSATLGIVAYGDGYDIMLNGQPLVSGIPLVYQGGRLGVTTWNSKIAFDSVNISIFEGEKPAVAEVVDAESAEIETSNLIIELPWREDFSETTEVTFAQTGGNWQIRDGAITQLQTDVSDIIAIVPNLILGADQPYEFSTQIEILEGPNGGGIVFNVQNSDTIRESHIIRFGNNEESDYMIYGYFDENRSYNNQGAATPPDLSGPVTLGVSVNGDNYSILINGEPAASGIPIIYQGGQVALTSWNSSVAFDDISVASIGSAPAETVESQPESDTQDAETVTETEAVSGEEETISAETTSADSETTSADAEATADEGEVVPLTEDFFANPRPINSYFTVPLNEDTSFSNWRILNGDWEIQADGIVHPNAQWFDNLIIHANAYDQYTLKATFQMGEGEGGSGVAFNIPSADSIAGAHIARYLNNEAVSWGYFDDDGRYVEQGKTTVVNGSTDSHTFEINVDGENYSVTLDGELLDSDLPLFSTEGRVGFTTTQRVVTFADIAISAFSSNAQDE